MTETLPPSTRRGLSGTALKGIACVTMLIDHVGASCLENGFLSAPAAPAGLAALDLVLRLIGRLAFPIFCFLLVEGFVHTHDVKKYIGRLLLFGLVSEVPFDLAFFRTPFAPGYQNVYWTLALGVLAMAGLNHFEKPDGSTGWQGLLCAGGCVLLGFLANTDYNGIGVLIICALYLTRAARQKDTELDENLPAPDQMEDGSVLDAVRALPENYRNAVYLHYYEGYTAAEVGRMLGAPTNTVLSWLRRARAQLHTMLKEEIEDEVV